jgi:uncharacterized repeat protein (TIGR02543 family)
VTLTLATNSGTLARTGYTFAGWNTASIGNGTDYATGASYTTNAAVTLYAKWTALPDLSSITPADGSTGVHAWTNFVITFNKSTDGSTAGTVSFTSPSLTLTNGSNCVMTFSTSSQTNDRVTVALRKELAATLAGTTYSGLSISGFRDASNNNITYTDVNYDFTVTGDVAFYPFTGNSADSSGNGYNGTVFGASLTTDRFGASNRAYSFNGTSNYIEIADNSNLDLISDYTISVWINASSLGQYKGIISKYQNDNDFGFSLRTGLNSPYTAIDFYDNQTSYGTISTGTWYHVVVTATSNSFNTYINGVSQRTGSITTLVNNATPVRIGVDYMVSGTRFFNGVIDDVRIYKYGMTADEVTNIYNAERP